MSRPRIRRLMLWSPWIALALVLGWYRGQDERWAEIAVMVIFVVLLIGWLASWAVPRLRRGGGAGPR